MTISILGIDLAKDSYQVTLLHRQRTYRQQFRNEAAAFAELSRWLQRQGVTALHACMESTGRYGEPLATYLYEQGYTVSVVNPVQIKHHAKSQLRRNKTDKVDADVIAHFAQTQQPSAWQPTPPEIRELEELVHQYDALQTARQQEHNRLQAGVKSESVRQLLSEHLAFLDTQLAEVWRLIEEQIDRHPDLKANQALLTSIPGIGALTAAKLQTLQLQRFHDVRAATAFVGLNPRQHDSGSSVHRRAHLSKVGHAEMRRALYMPAVVAKRFNPRVRELSTRLAERGKHNLAIIGAAMHKLLCLAYGVLKSGKPFDPNFSKIHPVTP
jgi:transposase